MKMKAIARFGKEFGSYKLVEVPYPTCGPEDIILEIKAAAICGTDMKHWNYEQPLEKRLVTLSPERLFLYLMMSGSKAPDFADDVARAADEGQRQQIQHAEHRPVFQPSARTAPSRNRAAPPTNRFTKQTAKLSARRVTDLFQGPASVKRTVAMSI